LAISTLPSTTVRKLLKSCAMPPAQDAQRLQLARAQQFLFYLFALPDSV